MKILKWLFSKRKTTNDFYVEFYPTTNRYYPKYKDSYIRRVHHTGILRPIGEHFFHFADWGNTEKEADKLIAEFKEQLLKENVTIIRK